MLLASFIFLKSSIRENLLIEIHKLYFNGINSVSFFLEQLAFVNHLDTEEQNHQQSII